MKKPNKIYNLTIVYNDSADQIEYIEETVELNDGKSEYGILDLTDVWDEESLDSILKNYTLAEA